MSLAFWFWQFHKSASGSLYQQPLCLRVEGRTYKALKSLKVISQKIDIFLIFFCHTFKIWTNPETWMHQAGVSLTGPGIGITGCKVDFVRIVWPSKELQCKKYCPPVKTVDLLLKLIVKPLISQIPVPILPLWAPLEMAEWGWPLVSGLLRFHCNTTRKARRRGWQIHGQAWREHLSTPVNTQL